MYMNTLPLLLLIILYNLCETKQTKKFPVLACLQTPVGSKTNRVIPINTHE